MESIQHYNKDLPTAESFWPTAGVILSLSLVHTSHNGRDTKLD